MNKLKLAIRNKCRGIVTFGVVFCMTTLVLTRSKNTRTFEPIQMGRVFIIPFIAPTWQQVIFHLFTHVKKWLASQHLMTELKILQNIGYVSQAEFYEEGICNLWNDKALKLGAIHKLRHTLRGGGGRQSVTLCEGGGEILNFVTSHFKNSIKAILHV